MTRSLLGEMPQIRRAREYRLYSASGKRFLDFYQDGGHAILGHRPSRTILDIKNLLSRGQIAAYPSAYFAQAKKALLTLFPTAKEFRLYKSLESAISAIELHTGETIRPEMMSDPGRDDECSGRCSLWRPFVDEDRMGAPVLVPILPIPMPPAPAVVVFREKPSPDVPVSDICSPVSLVALKRGIYDLIRFMEDTDRKAWEAFDGIDPWSRYGPYLNLAIDLADFPQVFHGFLEGGIVISPIFGRPSIIPPLYTTGEVKHFDKYRDFGAIHGNS